MRGGRRFALLAVGVGSVVAAVLHVAIASVGPDAYTWIGAAGLARADARGAWWPEAAALLVMYGLLLLAVSAFSLAGALRPIRAARPIVTAAGALFVVRGLSFVPDLWRAATDGSPWRFAAFSAVALGVGLLLLYASGPWDRRTWAHHRGRAAHAP
jgi:hypothetical protein